MIWPELWFLSNMEKSNKDLILAQIASFNNFAFDPVSEIFRDASGTALLGYPLTGT